MISIKKFCKFLIFGKISLGHKEPEIFEEKATEENSVRIIHFILIFSETSLNGHQSIEGTIQLLRSFSCEPTTNVLKSEPPE